MKNTFYLYCIVNDKLHLQYPFILKAYYLIYLI